MQVLATGTPTRRAPMCAFRITDFPATRGEPTIVEVELPAVEMTFVGLEDVKAFELFWKHMTEAALPPRESVALISRLLHGLEHRPEEFCNVQ